MVADTARSIHKELVKPPTVIVSRVEQGQEPQASANQGSIKRSRMTREQEETLATSRKMKHQETQQGRELSEGHQEARTQDEEGRRARESGHTPLFREPGEIDHEQELEDGAVEAPKIELTRAKEPKGGGSTKMGLGAPTSTKDGVEMPSAERKQSQIL